MKERIFNAHGLFSVFYKLRFEDSLLDNNTKMLKDYGINDASVINLIPCHPEDNKKKFFRLAID
jgi:hypothetical protein